MDIENFETPMKDEFNLQVTTALQNPYDGGTNFTVSAMGIGIRLHNQGLLKVFGDRDQFIGSKLSLDRDETKQTHKYVFRFLFKQRRIELVLNDDGNYQSNPQLAVWNMPSYIPNTVEKISWNISEGRWLGAVTLEILPPSTTPTPADNPFQNWHLKNHVTPLPGVN
jgi:hypothetical protein